MIEGQNMSDKSKKILIALMVIIAILFLYKSFNKDGSSYNECMENRRSTIDNDAQYFIAQEYCRSKHADN
jgi:hypothetical protein